MFGRRTQLKPKPVIRFSQLPLGIKFKRANDNQLYFKSSKIEYSKKESEYNCIKCYLVNEDFVVEPMEK